MQHVHGGITPGPVVIANGMPHMLHMRRRERPSGSSGRSTKGKTMKNLIARLRTRATQNANYRRIRDEIAGLSRAEALDMGIFPADAERLARKAVWG